MGNPARFTELLSDPLFAKLWEPPVVVCDFALDAELVSPMWPTFSPLETDWASAEEEEPVTVAGVSYWFGCLGRKRPPNNWAAKHSRRKRKERSDKHSAFKSTSVCVGAYNVPSRPRPTTTKPMAYYDYGKVDWVICTTRVRSDCCTVSTLTENEDGRAGATAWHVDFCKIRHLCVYFSSGCGIDIGHKQHYLYWVELLLFIGSPSMAVAWRCT